MMKKIISILLVAAMLTLSGCSGNPQPTMEELMAEVNAEHQTVERFEGDLSPYLREPTESIEFERLTLFPEAKAEYQPKKVLTFEQAKEDIDFVFHVFHDTYGLYDYFGGDEAFSQAKQSVLQQCESAETLTCEFLVQSLVQNLSFVKDGHFSIAQQSAAPRICPFFYREVAFVKTEEGYQSEDGKQVESVESYEDLDQLFRRSISPQGELVYYPVVLKEVEDPSLQGTYQNNEPLVVRYQGGETQTLTAEAFEMYDELLPERTVTEEVEGIPVLRLQFFDSQGSRERREFLEDHADAPVQIIDLRTNGGGFWQDAQSVMMDYVGQAVPTNSVEVDAWTGNYQDEQDQFAENEKLLIVLTGKYTASAAEQFVDAIHNVENVLIVGENTNGCILTAAGSSYLPNSNAPMVLGANLVHVFPGEGFFEELRGLYPDIWAPAGEAEELVIKLVEQLNR